MSPQHLEDMTKPVTSSNSAANSKPAAACKPASTSKLAAKSSATINFHEFICVYFPWVGHTSPCQVSAQTAKGTPPPWI